jgi:hypothetical protein
MAISQQLSSQSDAGRRNAFAITVAEILESAEYASINRVLRPYGRLLQCWANITGISLQVR